MGSAISYISRIIDINKLIAQRSLFLFGPRQTGKSSFIKNQINEEPLKIYNLLDQGLYQRVITNPELIRQELSATEKRHQLIIIDEIQKVPALLDEVHLMTARRRYEFYLLTCIRKLNP